MFSEKNIINQAIKKEKTIVFPEAGFCERVIEAARIINKRKIAKVILLGDESALVLRYKDKIKGMTIINPKTSTIFEILVEVLLSKRKEKGLTRKEAEELVLDPLYFGALLVEAGFADGMVAGAKSSSADVLRTALKVVGSKNKNEIVSSFVILYGKNKILGREKVIFASDIGLNINPDANQLVQITKDTVKSFEKITNAKARVAMLSYSTKGSGMGESVDKVKKAMDKLKKEPFIIDGELQLDAALIPRIRRIKLKESSLKKPANVLIFPDLNSGNITYKAIQHFGKVKAIGPVLQNLNKPINDLSRGCNVKDIILLTALTVLQS